MCMVVPLVFYSLRFRLIELNSITLIKQDIGRNLYTLKAYFVHQIRLDILFMLNRVTYF